LPDRPSRLAIAAALLSLYLIWGSTYLAIAVAIETLPPFTMAGARFLFAGLLMYAVLRFRGAPAPPRANWRGAALVGGLMLLGGNGLVCWAEQRVLSGLASVFIATVPLWAALFDWARPSGRRPTLRVAAGIALGFAGVALLAKPGSDPVDGWGAFALVSAAAAWAAGSVASRHVPLPESPFVATGMEMISGGALLLLTGALAGEWGTFRPAAVTPASLAAVAYLVAFGSLVGFTAFIWLLQVTTPAVATTYAYVNPVVALALGAIFRREALAPRTITAAAIVIGAVALILTARRPTSAPSSGPSSESAPGTPPSGRRTAAARSGAAPPEPRPGTIPAAPEPPTSRRDSSGRGSGRS
jgi:drug/metabolite transporter (DMT)-like permease